MTAKLVRHIHSNAEYWYHGPVPGTNLSVVVTKGGGNAYTIGNSEYSAFYVEVPSFFEEGKKYKSKMTGSIMLVENVYKNPDNGVQVAFGWRRTSPEVQATPVYVEEVAFDNWEIV